MKLPSVSLALALSLAAASYGMSYALPSPESVERLAERQRAANICDGYQLLHVRLASIRAAEGFRLRECIKLVDAVPPAAAATITPGMGNSEPSR